MGQWDKSDADKLRPCPRPRFNVKGAPGTSGLVKLGKAADQCSTNPQPTGYYREEE
jgi:hypothetical protein